MDFFSAYFSLVPAERSDVHIFGFADFVPALAILIVILTMTDIRYRFRVSVAPIPILGIAYSTAAIVGLSLLVMEFLYALGWRVPVFLSNPSVVQFWLGLWFFLSIFLWISYAFIWQLSTFRVSNAKKIYRQVESAIVRGSDSELPTIAMELVRSAGRFIKLSKLPQQAFQNSKRGLRMNAGDYAYNLLYILGNRKFCHHVARSSYALAIVIFSEMTRQKKYDLPVNDFALNVFTEALINEDSILYRENVDYPYGKGLIGNLRPFTQSLFSDFDLITVLAGQGPSPFDVSYKVVSIWTSKQLEIYSGCLLNFSKAFFEKIVKEKWVFNSAAYYRGLQVLESSSRDLSKINNFSEDYWVSEQYKKFDAAVKFIKYTFELFNAQKDFPENALRNKSEKNRDIHDHLSSLMYDLIWAASWVTEPFNKCWSIQYGTVFDAFFQGYGDVSHPVKIVRHRLRRLIYDEINGPATSQNYKSVRFIGYCLNVDGLSLISKDQLKQRCDYDFYPLHKTILSWVKKNFLNCINIILSWLSCV